MKLVLLRKVLALEQSLGYTNQAVVGGLDGFLRRWAPEAHQAMPNPMMRTAMARLGLMEPRYDAMAPHERARWVETVLRWSAGFDPGSPPSAPPAGGSAKMAAAAPPKKPAPPRTTLPVSEKRTKAPASPRLATPFLAPGQGLDTPLGEVKAFRKDLVALLDRLGIATVRDMLYCFPRKHIDFTNSQPIASLQVGADQTAVGTVWEAHEVQLGGRRVKSTELIVGDDSGNVRAIWFNQGWIARSFKTGMRVALSGRVNTFRGRKVFENPEYEVADAEESVHTGRLVPVYPLTEGLTGRRMRAIAKRTLDAALPLVADFLPQAQRARVQMLDLPTAIREAHFPTGEQRKDEARRRLAFDELLLIQLGVLGHKRVWKEAVPGHPLPADPRVLDGFVRSLPFALTGAQQRVLGEVVADLARSTPMSRLVQGEVGSGKTVIALAAMLVAVANRQQAALMAPTELLAEQHHRTVTRLLGPEAQPTAARELRAFTVPWRSRPITVALLTGSLSRKRKQEIARLATQGEVDMVIGTHALFQKEVEFSNLGLAVVDEQHRFGVMQRSELRQKGYNPHLLAMTATPIPRSLALTLYGDLDISVIDELPPGRQTIRTRWLEASQREKAYRFIRKEVAEGRQAFIVYPLIEESEKLDVAAATEEHERLGRDIFPDLRLGLLHGRMKQVEKDAVMRAFRAGEVQILISTAVVEVGIDVPNATVMMIEAADRFGLAQLHQFRGRVGRGEHQSYCILVSEAPSAEATDRLAILERVNDGFALAEEDLRLRGAGEFFGTRQSGLPDLRMARISDAALLDLAREEATRLFEEDPELRKPAHQALAREVERAWLHRTLAIGEA